MNLEVIAHLICPLVITLMSSKEKLICKKVPLVLLFFTPINNREYEDYGHHLLLLFYPFRNEADLKVGVPPSQTNKIVEPDKKDIKRNRAMLNHLVKLLIKHYYTTINQH